MAVSVQPCTFAFQLSVARTVPQYQCGVSRRDFARSLSNGTLFCCWMKLIYSLRNEHYIASNEIGSSRSSQHHSLGLLSKSAGLSAAALSSNASTYRVKRLLKVFRYSFCSEGFPHARRSTGDRVNIQRGTHSRSTYWRSTVRPCPFPTTTSSNLGPS